MQILKYIFIGLLIFLTCGCGGKKKQGEFRYFRNYQRTFNDLNDKHLKAARQWGIQPVTSDELLEDPFYPLFGSPGREIIEDDWPEFSGFPFQ